MIGSMRQWLGVAGVPPDDDKSLCEWEHRLRWVMMTAAILSVPAALVDHLAKGRAWRTGIWLVDLLIFTVFAAELAWMLRLSRRPWRYLLNNWLDLVIIGAAAASLFGADSEWIAIMRMLRITLVSLLMLRLLTALRDTSSPQGIPFLVVFGCISLGLAGAGFYALEPTVHSYWEGLWLAFATGTTVGYGDFVPTTGASRLFAGLMVVAGFGTLSLIVAQLTAFFVGQDEVALRHALHGDIRQLRTDLARLIGGEEQHVLRALHAEISELRRELARVRLELPAAAAKARDTE